MHENIIDTLRIDRRKLLVAVKNALFFLSHVPMTNQHLARAGVILYDVREEVENGRIVCSLKEKN